jgi:hypothetical protein
MTFWRQAAMPEHRVPVSRFNGERAAIRCCAARGGLPDMTLNPLIVGLVIFAMALAGAVVGWAMRQRLPSHHLTDETRSVVSVSMAMVATI